ncbi:unnamed protein product [Prorocentrum cordatum]|uniref:Uncharacterized protein n=1 Tax=Prorocentrum cordatum TaxID=2364126 RepID=A0ABN9TME0_9DINO|nr:unnamed protein product [Polarella glacialis]
MSAAAFLAAVKARLVEWGKVDLYHEFVMSLSGTVDAKAAVRILRGHDDLLSVFRSKFAPKSDLIAIKAELREEDEKEEAPRPPPGPPRRGAKAEPGGAPLTPAGGGVKRELGGPRPPDGPRPPAGPPGVKKEMVKSEVKREAVAPKPPKHDPNALRGTVTIGDESESEDEEVHGEASVAAAVRKGRNECIAQLSKILFRRERGHGEGARQRLTMVRYATRVASRPRFPRELFILRGPPGVGKTEYALLQLQDYAEWERDEEFAARLSHVCAADDFFEELSGTGTVYKFAPARLEAYHRRNEARVRLAMEAGVHPLFVDCAHLRLWEMAPYLLLADRLGYVATVVEPQDICQKWDDVDHLLTANSTADRTGVGKMGPDRGQLHAMLRAFEPLPLVEDPLLAVRLAVRPAGPRAVDARLPPPGPSSTPSRAPSQHGGAAGVLRVKAEAAEAEGGGSGRGRAGAPSTAAAGIEWH